MAANINETGSLQVNSENLLPIIKKWLYSDTDIFLRELVSNGCDAINKLQRVISAGDYELPGEGEEKEKFAVHVKIDKKAKTLTVSDNGIGMDADEVRLYINQIAKSSAAEFLEKYKTDATDIIGHFGLGFYSAFMAADTVEIQTLSYKPSAEPVKWVSSGGATYEMSEGSRKTRGTDIILTVSAESKEFLEEYKVRSILRKYMQFVPVEVYFDNDYKEEKKKDKKDKSGDKDENKDENEEKNKEENVPKPINETRPLWLKNASEITDDEYITFYHKLFTDFNPPLFWIHLNMDYPHRLRGILFFPKLNHEIEYVEGQVKLYCNQVFIADNIKEVIPEFLLLLKGVADCPDLPLNVSRSFLQNDGYAAKLSGYITKKVADKLNGMFKNEREKYEKFWDDISPFIKYGCIKEKDFYEKIKPSLLYKTAGGKYLTTDEYLAANEAKIGKKIYYASDEKQQSRYINLLAEQGIDVALLTARLDTPFVSYVENAEFKPRPYKDPKDAKDETDEAEEDFDEGLKFVRIDAAISDSLKADVIEENDATAGENAKLIELFKKNLQNSDKLAIEIETLKTGDVPAIILLSEEARRMQDMSRYFAQMPGFGADMAGDEKLVLNRANSLIKTLMNMEDGENAAIICKQAYDLARMSHKQFEPDEMNEFIVRSNKILEILAER